MLEGKGESKETKLETPKVEEKSRETTAKALTSNIRKGRRD